MIRLLRLLSRPTNSSRVLTDAHALDYSIEVFPNLLDIVKGKDVLDFGCKEGLQSCAFASRGAKRVFGCDIDTEALSKAVALANATNLSNVQFGTEAKGRFDIIFSQDAAEHFIHPKMVLEEWGHLLRPGGKVYITFGPPWFAPYGAHMYFFTKCPWVNILFSERTVFTVRASYRHDGYKTWEEAGMGKLSIRRWERLLAGSAFRVEKQRYDCCWGLNFAQHIPVVRELMINRVTAILVAV
jgi:SAM-dependent methyltransferase